jgi:hypothetical protein
MSEQLGVERGRQVTDTRRFTYRGRIKVSRSDLALAKAGKKTCTIRRGHAGVNGTSIDLTDNRETLKVKILSVETRAYKELTSEHAVWEGFSTLDELKRDLAIYYRDIGDDDPVTIIKFEADRS